MLLDLEMPVMDGMTALPLLLARNPKLQIIIISTKTRENAALAMHRCKLKSFFAPGGTT